MEKVSTVKSRTFSNETITSSNFYLYGNSTHEYEAFSTSAIVLIGISAFLFLASVYLCFALWWYFKCKRRCVMRTESIKDCPKQTRNGNLLRYFCVTASIMLLLTSLSGVVMFVTFQVFPSASYCNWMSKGHFVLRSVTEILLNTILWMRQKIFYQHPALGHVTSKLTNRVSWTFFVLMLCSALMSLLVFMFGHYQVLETQCLTHKEYEIFDVDERVFFALTVTLIIIYRLLFLGLLLYPLIKHKKDLNKSRINEKHQGNVMKVIGRVLVADILCIMLFISVAVLTTTLLATQAVMLLILIWESELVLGFVFIMLSFVDWKKRLLPWYASRSKLLRRSTREASRRSVWVNISLRV